MKPIIYELTPRDEGGDNQSNMRRPADGEKSVPTTDGRPATGPQTIIRPKGGEAETEAVQLLHEAPPPSEVPDWSDGEAMPLIIIDNNSEMLPTNGYWPILTICYQNLTKSISPNRVRKGHSQDMPAEGSLFDVSPDIPGFHMRPAGGGVQQADTTQPPPPNYVGFNNPFFGAPIAFAQCQSTSGMDTTTTLPIYSIPKDSSIGIDQSAVPTVYASGVSPDAIPWSTAEDVIRDIVREGPFDVDTTPMDTEDSPLINTSITATPPTVSGVHRSSGVGKTFESVSIVLGGQVRTRKCYGGRRKPATGRWVHDVESSNSGTVCNIVASDVGGNVEHRCGSCGVSG